MKLLLGSIIITLLVGCSASGPIYQPYEAELENTSIVYVYRPSKAVNCCVAPAVYINGNKEHSLKNGGYLVYELPSGSYQITVGDGSYGFSPQTRDLNTEPGQSYYLKWVIGSLNQFDSMVVGGMGVAYAPRNYHLVQIPVEKAQQEIEKLKLSKP